MKLGGKKILIYLLATSCLHGTESVELASYKEAGMIWLGSATGVLQPLAEEFVLAPTSGTLDFLVKDGEMVKPREIWAILGKDRLAQKEKDHALAEKDHGYSLDNLKEKYRSEGKKSEEQIKKIQEKIDQLQLTKDLPEVSELSNQIEQSITELNQKIQELKDAYAKTYSPERLAFEKEKLHQVLLKKRQDLADYREEIQMRAEVGGQLRYLLPKVRFEDGSEVKARLKPGDQIALIRDDRVIMVAVPQTSFPMPLVNSKSYLARIRSEAGSSFTGFYHDKITILENSKSVSYYRFRIRDVDLPIARSGLGQKALVNVMETFKRRVTIIPKADLLEKNADLVQQKGWVGAAILTWPNYEVISEGFGSLALSKKEIKKERAIK